MSCPEDPTAETRTKKREPGKITKAIKLGVVGDGTYYKHFNLDSLICGKKKTYFSLSSS